MDIIFLVDSSDRIGIENYDKQKSLVISIARSFGISHNTSRAAVIRYSDSASAYFQFEDSSSINKFERAIHRMSLQKGLPRLDKAFDVALADLLPQARRGIPKIAFVVTNGKQNSGEDMKALDAASELLRRAGVKVIALGVGTEVHLEELKIIVEDEEEHIVTAESYSELILNKENISEKICEQAG